MPDFRENYLKAREIVAQELIQKYNLSESYKDDNRLTLDSAKHSIHLTFYVPDGDNVSISDKGKQPGHGRNFMYYLFEQYPNETERTQALTELYKNSRANGDFDFSMESIQDNLQIMVGFISKAYPTFFL